MGRPRRRIVIITGTPGVGKHTIAKHLIQMADGWHMIDLSRYARASGLLADCGHHCTSGEVDTAELSRRITKDVLAGPGDHIVVGHLAPYVVPRDCVILAVILRRNPYELAKTYRQRGYSESKLLENTGAEVLGTVAYDTFAASYGATLQYDTTNQDSQYVASCIYDSLCAACSGTLQGQHDKPGPLDWLYGFSTTNKMHAGNSNQSADAAQAARRMLEDLVPDWPHLRDEID